MNSKLKKNLAFDLHRQFRTFATAGLFSMFMLASFAAFANNNMGADATKKICGVLGTIHSLLNVASIVIVTIAIVFAGYQIAFAHKRISDVAPILIGALLIGAAAQLAKMMIANQNTSSSGADGCNITTSMIGAAVQYYA